MKNKLNALMDSNIKKNYKVLLWGIFERLKKCEFAKYFWFYAEHKNVRSRQILLYHQNDIYLFDHKKDEINPLGKPNWLHILIKGHTI